MGLSQTEHDQIETATRPFPERQSGLLPALYIVQEARGHLDQQAMIDIGEFFDLNPMQVREVASFYTMFNQHPVGKHHLQVCRSVSCYVMGANPLIEHLRQRLGIEPGQTTADGRFTLSAVECLGSCGTAPAMQVNEDYHEDLTEEKLDQLLAGLQD